MHRLLTNPLAITLSIATVAATLPAQAATFTPFSFKTNVTASPDLSGNPFLLNDPTRDIRLDSVEFGGLTIDQFEVVKTGKVIQNDTATLPSGEVYGILHSGRGPNTPLDPLIGEGPSKPNPTDQDIADSLGNLNLNSLLVTRENADTAIIEIFFDKPVNKFFFWERGGNPAGTVAGDSDILIEALGSDGAILASYKILRENYTKAGYNISTRVESPIPGNPPILNNGPFNIGSIGLSLGSTFTQALRLTSTANNLGAANGDNGPDFKIVAARVTVPEPSLVISTLVAGGMGIMLKGKNQLN